ncbi:hypothetical protein Xhom_03098 [Xenorhabdus hominickii]|uniref:Uncharacterized protein n=1 Tax=Xenorhabdus hominickii TaxID=351679 RepID=A0A2G0Q481_XENHO|nr:hypothetical protein Xhom_03098 [Xenorhabdus hominickii]
MSYKSRFVIWDTFTRIGLLPVKVDVRSAIWSLDKQNLDQHNDNQSNK